MNGVSPRHSRLSRSSIAVVRVNEEEAPIPKRSKGTVLRRQAEDQWSEIIKQVYTNPKNVAVTKDIADDDLIPYISDLFREVLGQAIDPGKDVCPQGVDSIACAQIMKQIQAMLFPAERKSLPQNLIYGRSTVLALPNTLKRIRGKAILQLVTMSNSCSGCDSSLKDTLQRPLSRRRSQRSKILWWF